MQFEDKMAIATPEGVPLEVTLAGVGSRAGAATLDGLIQGVIAFFLFLILGGVDAGIDFDTGGSDSEFAFLVVAVVQVALFVLFFFYFVLFETFSSGRTPGKRAFRLRVVQVSGARIGFRASLIRNILRLVDLLPAFYLAGIVAIATTERNQRLGDLVAGTVVIIERPNAPAQTWTASAVLTGGARPSSGIPEVTRTWDVSAVTNDELIAIRTFLDRRHSIPLEVRDRLARDLETKLRPKVAGAHEWHGYPEVFLELLAAVKTARS